MVAQLFRERFPHSDFVITGEQDFRVPYTQGLQLFTSLQLQKVPSKLLEFPDEGHWVLKPQNSVLWYKLIPRLDRGWTKKGWRRRMRGGRETLSQVAWRSLD